jgi:hypothetical protein
VGLTWLLAACSDSKTDNASGKTLAEAGAAGATTASVAGASGANVDLVAGGAGTADTSSASLAAGHAGEFAVLRAGGSSGSAGAAGSIGLTAGSAGTASSSKPKLVYLIDTGSASTSLPDLLPGIHVFDSTTNTLIKSATFTERKGVSIGHFASLSPDGAYLWLCNDLGNVTADKGTVDVYDTATLTVVKRFKDVGCGVQNTRSRNGNYVLTSSTLTNKINIFSVQNQTLLGSVDVASAPHVGDTSADDKIFYTTNAALGHALAFDISQLPGTVPAAPFWDVEVGGNLHALRLHPNGKYLFVGASATTGTNVIDVATKTIIAQIPGAPHNYAISPDAKYLASSELTVDATRGTGERLQVIDISTLSTATPDPAKIRQVATLAHPGWGGSHESWAPATGKLWYTLYSNTDKKGQVWVLDTSMLPDMVMVDAKIPIGDAPHGLAFADHND